MERKTQEKKRKLKKEDWDLEGFFDVARKILREERWGGLK